MSRGSIAAWMCLVLAVPVRADDAEPSTRPRVRVSSDERGALLPPLLAELEALGVEVDERATDVPTVGASLRVLDSTPPGLVVEIWFDGARVSRVDGDDPPAAVALRTVELLRAVLVGARAFEREPAAEEPPAAEPAPPPDSPRADVGATFGGGLVASPGGGVVPLVSLGLSWRSASFVELVTWAGIPVADDVTRVAEGRVDVRVAPLDLSVRYAPRFGRIGLSVGANVGVVSARVVGATENETLLGRTRRAWLATVGGVLGARLAIGETLEWAIEGSVGRVFSPLEVRVSDREVRTWSTWVQATSVLRVRLTR
ncbi:MAG: hypothetical protein H6721_31485 [Sandaracinus sp.]|nr:hypothetical protein [Sandaracinus sp.]